jgi:hypothetical protein
MYSSHSRSTISPLRSGRAVGRSSFLVAALCTLGLLGACNTGSGGGSTGMVGSPGDEMEKPDGSGAFIVDPNKSGAASKFQIAEMFWGRLVDIHDVDASGDANVQPVFKDFVINENVQADGSNYLLETNPVTQQTRLVVLRTKDDPTDAPGDTFIDLVRQTTQNMPPIAPMEDGMLGPFSFMTRNGALVVRFDDLLDDDATALANLPQVVKVLTGYPPTTPFQPRLLFDTNHGGIGGGQYHSTRLIIDMTVSEAEAADPTVTAPVNSLGLPPSLTSLPGPAANISLRIPTRTDFASGQFLTLQNLAGADLVGTQAWDADLADPTRDVVRDMRSGNDLDSNNGFLLDLNSPEVVGGWPLTVDVAADDPTGQAGFDFTVDITFTTICRAAPLVGDIIELPGAFLEVSALAGQPDALGKVKGVPVRNLGSLPITTPGSLVGGATYLTPYQAGLFGPGALGCWISFVPAPGVFPATDVQPSSQVLVRFSEPMDPAGVLPFDSFMVSKDDPALSSDEYSLVVGDILASSDLKEYTFASLLPLEHTASSAEEYFVQIVSGVGSVTDLAGNSLAVTPPDISFTLDPLALTEANGGIVMRFNSTDEIINGAASGRVDLRGQFFYDLNGGRITPRPFQRYEAIADVFQTIPGRMAAFPPGVQTPLSPLGSKVMNLYRYPDFGWNVSDETQYNIDIEGMWWSPVGGQVVSDFYPEFKTNLSHSLYLPDEAIDSGLLPLYPNSGLVTTLYANNILIDPVSPQTIVHDKPLGYVVSPFDLVAKLRGSSTTFLMPWPLNRGTDPTTYKYYTWRDTAVLATGGRNGAGIPMRIEVDAGVDPGPSGSIANPSQVPSFGLPLLVEHSCYPSDSGIGLNALDIAIAINSSSLPTFRIFSTGGLDTTGTLITKDPDLETKPTGGYNPGSTPPGKTTPVRDNVFYFGMLDLVVRVSRVHTVWLDSQNTNPAYLDPVLEPAVDDQPDGTAVVLEFRGATSITGTGPYDGAQIDAYGEASSGNVTFLGGDSTWRASIDLVDSARYIQTRFSFINNTVTGLNPELSAIGFAYLKQ